MKHFAIMAALAAAACGFTACSDEGEPGGGNENSSNDRIIIRLNSQEQNVCKAANDLAYRTFAEIYDNENNVAFSPLSTQMALAMVANGATDETLDEMLSQLCPGGTLSDLNSLNTKLLTTLPITDAQTTVAIANSFWHDNGFAVKPSFTQTLSDVFGAPAASYESLNPKAATETINKWISDNTDGKISKMVSEQEITAFMIVNALYFKSMWKKPFDKNKTNNDIFTNCDGSTATVPFMNGEVTADYIEFGGMEIADFDFGNYAYSFTVIKPAENETPLDALKEYNIATHTPGFVPDIADVFNVHVKMPRFTAHFKDNLKEALRNVGFSRMFDANKAQMGGISDKCTSINKVLHECLVEINEDGAEAVASTVANGMVTSPGPNPGEAYFTLDRPFAYMIRETSTGAILFMGAVNKM